MRAGEIVFKGMKRVVFGRPAAEAVAEAAERPGAKRLGGWWTWHIVRPTY
jgi:hypothetical protein